MHPERIMCRNCSYVCSDSIHSFLSVRVTYLRVLAYCSKANTVWGAAFAWASIAVAACAII